MFVALTIKQCRALYRLVAASAASFQREENKRLREIARELSHLRDAAALVEVTVYLKREIGTKSNAMLMDRLARRLESRRNRLAVATPADGAPLLKAARDLRQAASAVNGLALPDSPRKSADCLAAGWERVSRKARHAIAAASEDHEEGFHDLRKRSQDRWMHAALMRDLWPAAMTAIQRQAKALSDMLGHAQDLAVLSRTIDAAPELVADTVENEAVRDAIRTQQVRLRDECLRRATDLFGKAKRDRRTIRRLIRERTGR